MPPPEAVRLDPLSHDRFGAWADRSRRGFADQQAAAGAMPREDAERYAAAQLAALLPDGPATPGHHLWTVRDGDGRAVGHLWLRMPPGAREAYLFDIELLPEARGRGLGRATMLAAEEAARSLGATRMALNVFGHNTVAARLYDSLGYRVVDEVLTRSVEPPALAPYDEAADVRLEHPAQVNPGHDRWTALREGTPLGSVCLHPLKRSDGTHVEAHDLAGVEAADEATVLAATLRWCREHGAVSLAVSVPGSRAALRRRCLEAGFTLTAQLREKPL